MSTKQIIIIRLLMLVLASLPILWILAHKDVYELHWSLLCMYWLPFEIILLIPIVVFVMKFSKYVWVHWAAVLLSLMQISCFGILSLEFSSVSVSTGFLTIKKLLNKDVRFLTNATDCEPSKSGSNDIQNQESTANVVGSFDNIKENMSQADIEATKPHSIISIITDNGEQIIKILLVISLGVFVCYTSAWLINRIFPKNGGSGDDNTFSVIKDLPQPGSDIIPPAITDTIAQPGSDIIPPAITDTIAQPGSDIIPPAITDTIAQPGSDIIPPAITDTIAQPGSDIIPPAITDTIAQPGSDIIPPAITDTIAQPGSDIIPPAITDTIAQPGGNTGAALVARINRDIVDSKNISDAFKTSAPSTVTELTEDVILAKANAYALKRLAVEKKLAAKEAALAKLRGVLNLPEQGAADSEVASTAHNVFTDTIKDVFFS